ncbi:MAG: F0F1 ATP synthase subunit B [Amoebophilaceae bacterium]|jgi:F-type H+-transporting ATPase subunit b|nr:F0F1 ATP synthase subunit B [Amoebophilaceae bacterium]
MSLITPDFGLFFWQTVTLLVVLLILGKFAWGPILRAIQDREESIKEALRAAEVAREMTAQVQADREILLGTAYTERARIIEEAMATQRCIIDEAKAEAERVGKKMMEKTRERLAREHEASLSTLQNLVATLSVQIAEKLLRNELQQQHTQESLVQQLIKEARWV